MTFNLVLGSGTAPLMVSVHTRVNNSDTATSTKKTTGHTLLQGVKFNFQKTHKNYSYVETKQFKILVQLLKNTRRKSYFFF